MELKKIELQEDYLIVTLAGQLSVSEVFVLLTKVRDAATEKGLDKVLVDCWSVTGELSSLERYELGKTLAEHWVKGWPGLAKVAFVGTSPAIDGFGALVASNRGFCLAKTFSELPKALDWLKFSSGTPDLTTT
jgi:hypothetical protein